MTQETSPLTSNKGKDRRLACLAPARQHHDQLIRDAQEWIVDHLTEKNVLEQARGRSGLLARTFERRFKAATGIAGVKFVQRLRVELAKEILETQSVSIEQIAGDVGYVDPSSFRRLFSRLVGVTPGEYRKRFGPKCP